MDYVLSQTELESLHKVLFEILIELDRLCKKHAIEYGLDGGTLLGAVRHKGFIPWDDDLDVVMTRENYNRFRDIALKEMDSKRFFYQDHTTDENYRWGYARIRRKNSEFVRSGHEHLGMRTGIFLDIFPRDMLPDNLALRVVHCFCVFAMRKILYSGVGMLKCKNVLGRAVYRVLNQYPKDKVFARLEKSANHWNARSKRFAKCYTFPIPRRFCLGYRHEWFVLFTEIEFCGRMFPCAKDYDGYLKCDYGDYMELPPMKKRRQHTCSSFKLPEAFE
jgi:lipopolysaccharide cholinephosphotransferase